MSDYDYLNARVRGMSTSLLTRELYEQVLSSFTDTILMDALLASAYAEDMRSAMAERGPAPVARVVETAVRRSGHAAFARILSIAPPEPRRLLALQLNRWDVGNVLALLRARLAGAGPREAMAAVLPIGELNETQLAELAAEKDVESLADALTTWKHAFAFVLRRAIRECDARDDPRSLERALYGAYFTWALSQLRADDRQQALVRSSIKMHADMVNVVTLLAQVRDGSRSDLKGARSDPGEHGAQRSVEMIGRGTIPEKILRELGSAETLETAFEVLMNTYLARGIEKGILAYGQAQSLAVMERFLEEVVVERGCRLFRQDMLGLAVPLGFIWRKYCELANLRMLARGTAYRMSSPAIRQELVLV